jgi:hypothetical protein
MSSHKIDSVIATSLKGAVKFDGKNFHNFSLFLEEVLTTMELLHFLKGNDARPPEPTDEIYDTESVSGSNMAQATDEREKAAQAHKKETENQRRCCTWNVWNKDRARYMLIMRGICDEERNAAIADQTHSYEGFKILKKCYASSLQSKIIR